MTETLTRSKPLRVGLLEEIGSAVGQSLISLSDEFNARRHLFINKVDFADLADMMETERQDTISVKRPLHDRLLSAGVPKEDLLKGYQQVSDEQPFYLNPEKPLLIVKRTLLQNLLLPKSEKIRTEAALAFASILGTAILISLPYLDNPYMKQGAQNIEWRLRLLVKDEFLRYWDDLKSRYKNKETKKGFNEAEKKLGRLFTRDILRGEVVRFIPVGAKISMLFPGQTLTTAEYTIGKGFDEAVVSYINGEAMQRVTSILQKNQIIPSHKEKRDTANLGLVKVLLKRIGLPKIEDVIAAYVNSDISSFYLASEHPKINPYVYPS